MGKYDTVEKPLIVTDKRIKALTEKRNELFQKLEELRATDGDVSELEAQLTRISEQLEEMEAARDASLRPVIQEDRATPEQEEDEILKYAFLPDRDREAIKTKVLQDYQQRDMAYKALQRIFTR